MLLKFTDICCLKMFTFKKPLLFRLPFFSENSKLGFISGIMNATEVTEYLCNGDHLVTCSSVTLILKPCHLLSALHPVHVALI